MAENLKHKVDEIGRELRPHLLIEAAKLLGALLLGSSLVKGGYALLTHVNVQWWFLGIALGSGVGLLLGAYLYKPRPQKKVAIIPAQIESFNAVAVTQAALLLFFYDKAVYLRRVLEDVWHLWSNNGEKLIHPLAEKSDMKNFGTAESGLLLNRLNYFCTLYEEHLSDIKRCTPHFKSTVMDLGTPTDREYHVLMFDLNRHAELLKEAGTEAWEARLSTTEDSSGQ